MSKHVYIIRHAKADDPFKYTTDFERPLKKRGHNDAPNMGKLLRDRGLIPDLILASPSKRTEQTAEYIAAAVGYEKERIMWLDDLYLPTVEQIDDAITGLGAHEAKLIFVVCHNFGITEYANWKVDEFSIDNIPTCGVLGFELAINEWGENDKTTKGTYITYHRP